MVVPLEKVFKPKAFSEGVIVKVEDGVYRCNAGVSLVDTIKLASVGYATVIVTDKCITVAENFFPPEYELIRKGKAKVLEIYFVDFDKACDFIEELSKKKNIPLSKMEKTDGGD